MAQIFSLLGLEPDVFSEFIGSLAYAEEAMIASNERRHLEAKGLDSMNCRFIGFR